MKPYHTTTVHVEEEPVEEEPTEEEETSEEEELNKKEPNEEEQKEEEPKTQKEGRFTKTMRFTSGLSVGIGTSMSAFGFTSSGIGAGTLAAGVQSGIGNVAAGSAFATLQSFGALGGFVGMAAVGVVGLGLSLKNKKVAQS